MITYISYTKPFNCSLIVFAGSLFGSTTSTPSLFGQQQQTTGSLFGQQKAGGLFGTPTSSTTSTGFGTGFGTGTTTGLFGQTSTGQTVSPLFFFFFFFFLLIYLGTLDFKSSCPWFVFLTTLILANWPPSYPVLCPLVMVISDPVG